MNDARLEFMEVIQAFGNVQHLKLMLTLLSNSTCRYCLPEEHIPFWEQTLRNEQHCRCSSTGKQDKVYHLPGEIRRRTGEHLDGVVVAK